MRNNSQAREEATPLSGTPSTVTMATVLRAGDCTLSVSFTPDSISYTSATGSVPLTVNKASPSVTLSSSANPALASNSITLTGTVSSSVSTPTGTVDFYDGTTLLGSGTLASGTASYTTSSLALGTHSITAAYSGDSNFLSVTSSPVSQVISDLSLNIASGGSTTATVSAGGTATYNLTIGPSTGSTLPAAVSLAASGGPAGSTITITPATILAGAAATNVTVAVQVPAAIGTVRRSKVWALGLLFPFMAVLALPFGRGCGRLSFERAFIAIVLLIVILSAGALLGCGGGGSTAPAAGQPTNYTIIVTATSGSVSRSITLNLRVQ